MAKTMTLDELKKAIAALSPIKQRRRYPAALRAQVLRYAKSAIATGRSRTAICEELDIGEPTLTRFLKVRPDPTFQRVRVVDQPPERPAQVSVKGPCGLVIDGLSVAELAELVRRLSCSA